MRTRTIGSFVLAVTAAAGLTGCAAGGPSGAQTTVIVMATQTPSATSSAAAQQPAQTQQAAQQAAPQQQAPAARSVAAVPQAPAPVQGAAGGQAVQATALQAALQGLGYDVASTGVDDAQTAAAVRRFQTKHGLYVDGVAGPGTWSAIRDAQAKRTTTTTGDNYSSGDPGCMALERSWQAAISANSKSRSQSIHDQAAVRGCKPDLWYPENRTRHVTTDYHVDGEACSASEVGTIATGNTPSLMCSQVQEHVYQWVQGDY